MAEIADCCYYCYCCCGGDRSSRVDPVDCSALAAGDLCLHCCEAKMYLCFVYTKYVNNIDVIWYALIVSYLYIKFSFPQKMCLKLSPALSIRSLIFF